MQISISLLTRVPLKEQNALLGLFCALGKFLSRKRAAKNDESALLEAKRARCSFGKLKEQPSLCDSFRSRVRFPIRSLSLRHFP
jgi:hypothetical protein